MGPAWGREELGAFSQVASRLAIRANIPKSKVLGELYGHLSLMVWLLVLSMHVVSLALPIIQEHRAPLGLFINAAK